MSLHAGVLVGCVVAHIVLSPLLIFGWGPVPALGPAGAGWGLVIPFAVGSLIMIRYLRSSSSIVQLKFLAFTLSPTPRKFAATIAMNTRPVMVMPKAEKFRANALDMLAENAREAVEAEVMPEHITANATMKVTKWMPKPSGCRGPRR
jgi:Na+-driven multidrug efflux pump